MDFRSSVICLSWIISVTAYNLCDTKCLCSSYTRCNKELNETDLTVLSQHLNLKTRVTELEITLQKIQSVDICLFKNLTSLKKLSLPRNDLEYFPQNLSNCFLQNLTELSLIDNTKLTFSKNISFASYRNLEVLTLRNTDLNIIPSNAFRLLTNLKTLNLGFANIKKIDADAFSGLINLKIFDFQSNEITKIKSNTFKDFKSLRLLDLQKNKITKLEDFSFSGSNIFRIALKDNLLVNISKDAFTKCSIEHVDLSGNNIDCNCQTLSALFNKSRTITGTCYTPEKFQFLKITDAIAIARNPCNVSISCPSLEEKRKAPCVVVPKKPFFTSSVIIFISIAGVVLFLIVVVSALFYIRHLKQIKGNVGLTTDEDANIDQISCDKKNVKNELTSVPSNETAKKILASSQVKDDPHRKLSMVKLRLIRPNFLNYAENLNNMNTNLNSVPEIEINPETDTDTDGLSRRGIACHSNPLFVVDEPTKNCDQDTHCKEAYEKSNVKNAKTKRRKTGNTALSIPVVQP